MKDLLISSASYNKLSPFGRFLVDTRRFDIITKTGKTLDKWEAFEMGYRDYTRLIGGYYPVTLVSKWKKIRPE